MNWTRALVGAPYRDGGRGPKAFDCWGIVRQVFADQLGVDLPGYGDISADDLRRVAREMARGRDSWPWAPVEVPQEFDVAVMARPGGRAPVHVGVCTGAGTVLHTEQATGAVLVPLDSPLIRFRLLGFRRYAP
ncbi:MAG: C40 family peptidase [Rhodobacteraceae bacterium]|nr:C40 family peptidase [Paracoccaceae bacterium]MBR9820713.1 C40 family peptidase [Paracoccaceae bacterium]